MPQPLYVKDDDVDVIHQNDIDHNLNLLQQWKIANDNNDFNKIPHLLEQDAIAGLLTKIHKPNGLADIITNQ
ncbi:hypothetical protein HDU76_004872, partial [Blyttiomyces sp. JEL0837]